ncbi:MAG TPA: helix-turn-helix domain-containing protein [Spirochaetota bacterium]|nr:helix-turn-helix domain-containing protein [Spirochaetota bacterium]HPJ42211.1 helix-turn-helix domain-containing protein [Spirochaetota bacterium]HPR37852.1 helix-turn-helix domain-containing protein [Spirochaetota bacterium]
MPEKILYFIMFFGPSFAVIISAGQMMQSKKGFIDYLFALSFFSMALWMFQICFLSTTILTGWRYAFQFTMFITPLVYLTPPIIVFRYRWVLSSQFALNKYHGIFLVPAAASFLLLLFLPVSGIDKLSDYSLALPVTGDKFKTLPVYIKTLYITAIIPNLYMVALMSPVLIKMLPVWRRDSNNRISKPARMGYISALSIAVSNLICFIGYINSIRLVQLSILIANAATIYVYLITQRHHDYHRLLRSETRKAHYEKSRITGLDVNVIFNRLTELMRDEKVFADEELSLRDLSGELGISPHQLSEILNERIKKNFNTFVNEYRIDEAKKMLIEEPKRSILSVGIAVGFNSNTTFCTVFSKIEGVSPSQYRKQNL